MAHEPLPLPPAPVDDEFDDSEPTKNGVDRTLDYLRGRISDAETNWERQLAAVALEVRLQADATHRVADSMDELAKEVHALAREIGNLTRLVIEERAERIQLGDRVSQLEQPRPRVRRRM